MRRAWLACVVCAVCGCQSHDHGAGRASEMLRQSKAFTETVPGSTVTFTMRPVITWAGNEPRVLWIAETETTWDSYDVFYLWLDEAPDGSAAGREGPDAVTRPTPPYVPPDRGWGHQGYPAIGVTFHAAQKYCEWLTEKTGRRYRLPTVAEWREVGWEPCGTGLPPVYEMSWFAENAGERTHPVASLEPSPKGLFDVTGNVAEWCVAADSTPVVCGGSFESSWGAMTEDAFNTMFVEGERQTREWNETDPSFPRSKWWLRDAPFVGFRVVCEGPPK
jgi:formylglycine-generating enzyme required for sulfatase activity